MDKNTIRIGSLVLSFALLNGQALASGLSTYIVNGNNADISNYPSFASLFYDNGSSYGNYCGATIINSQYVLTAAHCFYEDMDGILNFYVAYGLQDESDYLLGSVEKARVEKYYFPDNYSNFESDLWANDIAVLKLETALNVSDYSSLLNSSTNGSYSGSAIAIGHGQISTNVNGGNRLLETTLTQVNSSMCSGGLSDSQICFTGALNNGLKNSTCKGDSGGPLYWDNGGGYVQIGITSFGPDTCGDPNENYTAAFTEVYDYRNWINSVINGQEQPKYQITTTSGIRTVVRNFVPSSRATATTTSSDSSGGALGWFTLMFMPFLIGVRRKFNMTLQPHAIFSNSKQY
ncbi:trypsin-like serine protease [Vibrio genomosp. F10]|uniref:trypsin-like serine protease n=1 Tax=Vibrio genomosp. F10 TaxID=723171 RepID=UPI000319EF14|nr:trypsin-like serine protease [Vibrio genomosp. F10]OEF03294.1 GlyGly-CTERM sorting domain-containing protein [Vibrio genomosp. F10 str. 9ZD137]